LTALEADPGARSTTAPAILIGLLPWGWSWRALDFAFPPDLSRARVIAGDAGSARRVATGVAGGERPGRIRRRSGPHRSLFVSRLIRIEDSGSTSTTASIPSR